MNAISTGNTGPPTCKFYEINTLPPHSVISRRIHQVFTTVIDFAAAVQQESSFQAAAAASLNPEILLAIPEL